MFATLGFWSNRHKVQGLAPISWQLVLTIVEESIIFMNRLIIYLLEGSKLYLPIFQFFCEHLASISSPFLGTLARDVAVKYFSLTLSTKNKG
jgi:hypothetical protein